MQSLDFFFFYGSTYTYLSVMRIEEVAARAGIQVRWRPFNVREVMIEQNNVPFRGKPIKMKYMWRDIGRRAERYGIDFGTIPPYPVDPEDLGNRVGVVSALEGWCPAYTKAVYQAWFLEHKAPGEVEHLENLLQGLGKDAGAVLARADSDEIRTQYAEETDYAKQHNIFGSPSFLVGKEVFWGDDRLEDAIDWLQKQKS